ncbi:MAG: aldehyde ferredoxin oxidoreductase family protein [Candidatus Helarchaeota archaeon]|nr:aldehyde ferredoxin oxidoreductase family protein [Candidatus Helarchaeota archaeon]
MLEFGWQNQIISINLDNEKHKIFGIEEETAHNYLGGRGLGVKLLCERISKNINPLSSKNYIIFATGPITATSVYTSGRFSAVSKSPLTGTIADANSGGIWGVSFKKCGYDSLMLTGAAKSPIYMYIDDNDVKIEDAQKLWGLNTHETTNKLLEIYGNRAKILCIGPAGENLVKFASIMNDKNRALGRGGLGAVMGSKKIKAIVVKGNKEVKIADKDKLDFFLNETKKWLDAITITGRSLPTFGTAVLVNIINEFGLFPIRNFQEGYSDLADKVSGESIKENILVRKTGCYKCPIACGRLTEVDGKTGKGPEYETVWALGPELGIFDLKKITKANYRCNELGIDTISTGVTIGCAMELKEKGFFNEAPSFGEVDKLGSLIEDITYRNGIGNELAEGSKILAESKSHPEFAMQVKGLELPAYDPRGAQGQGLAYATSNRGGCHLRAYIIGPELLGVPTLFDRFQTYNKPDLVIRTQNINAMLDSIIICKFTAFAISEDFYSRLLTAVTGIKFSSEDLMTIGERIWNLERLFNIREGFSKKDDILPKRFLTEPLKKGGSKGKVVKLDEMLSEYYTARGWDQDGTPLKTTLEKLGLKELTVNV